MNQENGSEIILLVEEKLPNFAKMIKKHYAEFKGSEDAPEVVLHQDAFAADYQPEEIILLGSAIKYAGMSGVVLNIIGKSRETLISPTDN